MIPPFKSFIERIDELTQREKEMAAKRKAARAKRGSKMGTATRAKPKKQPSEKPQPKQQKDVSGEHIVMQLRKAQDVDGNYDIRVAPGKTVRLKKGQINNLLKVHDRLPKPNQKRKFRVDLIRKLRKM